IAHQPIDLTNWRANQKYSGFLPEERAWMDRLVERGWRDVWRECNPDRVQYSWWSNRGQARAKDVGWRIDYLLATPTVKVTRAESPRTRSPPTHRRGQGASCAGATSNAVIASIDEPPRRQGRQERVKRARFSTTPSSALPWRAWRLGG